MHAAEQRRIKLPPAPLSGNDEEDGVGARLLGRPQSWKASRATEAATSITGSWRLAGPKDTKPSQRTLSDGTSGRGQAAAKRKAGQSIAVVRENFELALRQAGWRDSTTASYVKALTRDWRFKVAATTIIAAAVFVPDLCTLCQVPSNVLQDVMMGGAALFFLFEFACVLVTDSSYFLGFFFWMDILGAVSMIFDISFLLGEDALESNWVDVSKKSSFGMNGIARMVRLARAGRIARSFRGLRLLVSSAALVMGCGQLAVLATQLLTSLSTRISFLSLCTVVVIPFSLVLTFPTWDNSLQTWVLLLSRDVESYYAHGGAAHAPSVALLQRRLDHFSSFYTDRAYGPVEVCFRSNITAIFACGDDAIRPLTFATDFTTPRRKSSEWWVSGAYCRASFDLSAPLQIEALSRALLMCSSVVLMILVVLWLGMSIGQLTMVPIARILGLLHRSNFSITRLDEAYEELDEHGDNLDKMNEFVLLQKLIEKLTTVAKTAMRKVAPEQKQHMSSEDIMRLNFQGRLYLRGEVEDAEAARVGLRQTTAPKLNGLSAVQPAVLIAADTEAFNPQDIPKEALTSVACSLMFNMPQGSDWAKQHVEEVTLLGFAEAVKKESFPNPFHNFLHEIDVLASVRRNAVLCAASRLLQEPSIFALLVAALAHDVGHPGVNNRHLVETAHEYAIVYNDKAPLENMSCATIFRIAREPAANIFEGAQEDKAMYRAMREEIIECVLCTDVARHHALVKEVVVFHELHSQVFDTDRPRGEDDEPDGHSWLTPETTAAWKENKQLLLNTLIHTADNSGPLKPWSLCQRYGTLIMEEYFAMGEKAKAAGLVLQPLSDPDKVSIPAANLGFIELVACPWLEAAAKALPPLGTAFASLLSGNFSRWADLWCAEAPRSPEEISRTGDRVDSITTRAQALLPPGMLVLAMPWTGGGAAIRAEESGRLQ